MSTRPVPPSSGSRATPLQSAPPPSAKQQLQQPASRAWKWVEDGAGCAQPARYGTLARKLPSMLQTSGAGQTLAFLYSKQGKDKGQAESLLFRQLNDCLLEELRLERQADDPMSPLLRLTPEQYRAVSRRLAEVAQWLKRFAEGRLPRGNK